jgi:hypothetical protein
MHWEEKEVAYTTLRLPAFGTICSSFVFGMRKCKIIIEAWGTQLLMFESLAKKGK